MGRKITVEELECLRCKSKWWPRILNDKVKIPETCPKCRSPYWGKPVERKFVSENRKK